MGNALRAWVFQLGRRALDLGGVLGILSSMALTCLIFNGFNLAVQLLRPPALLAQRDSIMFLIVGHRKKPWTGGFQARPYAEEPVERLGSVLPGQERQPYLTWLLLAANFLIWVVLEISGRSQGIGGSENPEVLLDFGAMFGPLIADGQYWRLFTSMFLHVGMMHLLFNSIGLLIFGRIVEGTYGRLRFALIYVLAGLAGSVASYIINSAAIGAGASGAIFGVLGALVAFLVANREMLGEVGRQTLVAIAVLAAINIFFGFAASGVDNWAHLGGLAGGFALGMALTPRYKLAVGPFGMERQLVHSGAQIGWAVPLMMGAVLIAGAWLGTATVPDNAFTRIYKAERLLHQQSYAEALQEIDRSIQLDPSIGRAHYVRGKALLESGDEQSARAELGLAIRLGLDTDARREAVALLLSIDPGR